MRSTLKRMITGAPIATVTLAVIVVVAIVVPLLPVQSPTAQDLGVVLQPPAWEHGGSAAHLLGTDYLGRDLLSRILWGSRSTLVISALATLLGLIFGIVLGVVSAYYAGATDTVITTVFDIILAVPSILIAIVALSLFGGSAPLMVFVLGVPLIPFYGRVIRSQALVTSRQRYVTAARISGSSGRRIIRDHVLPNAAPPALALTPVYAGIIIIGQASLSFLGLSSSAVSWGFTVSENLGYISTAWWGATLPGLCILIVVVCCNRIGESLKYRASTVKGLALTARVRVRS
jgi:peptide/nickel transport system permease protein